MIDMIDMIDMIGRKDRHTLTTYAIGMIRRERVCLQECEVCVGVRACVCACVSHCVYISGATLVALIVGPFGSRFLIPIL